MSGTVMRDVVAAWRACAARGQQAVLATVVRVDGSGYRRPGARVLVAPDGGTTGAISGGCIESDLARRAWWRTRDERPTLVCYDATDADDDTLDAGSGCGGVVTVLLERLTPGTPNPLDVVAGVHDTRRPGFVLTSLDDPNVRCLVFPDGTRHASGTTLDAAADRLLASAVRATSTIVVDGAEVLVEVVAPPPALVVFGGGADARATVAFAAPLGWDVTATGSHAGRMRSALFPGADRVVLTPPNEPLAGVPLGPDVAVAVMTHSIALDRRILRGLAETPLAYLGVLGPRRRTDGILAELPDAGAKRLRSRLHAPIGLDIGADGPAEIALAIVAEVRASLADRDGGRLCDRPGPLHGLRLVASRGRA